MHSARPLDGYRILDLSQGLAGPSCAMYLAEYGARVIKVEPPEGDWSRALGARLGHSGAIGTVYNRGKEALCLDLKAPAARDVALKIAATCDVVIQSARPGAMERLGLGFEDVRKVRGNVVYVSVSGFGVTGPSSALPLSDAAAQAYSGLMSVNRGRDGVPHKLDTTIVDNVTGFYAFQATVMALWGRTAETPATHLDVSLLQAASAVQAHNVAEFSLTGRNPGLPNPPAGAFPTRDGWITITLVHEEHWRRIARVLGLDWLATDPRYATFAARSENLAALRAIMDARLKERTTSEWYQRLLAADVLSSPVNSYGDWLADPQALATQSAPEVEIAPGIAINIPRTPARPPFTAPSPALGEHTRALLAEFGIPTGAIDELIAAGIARDAGQPERT
jgi:crotonobetainyl-CoA:carnitine CoA-transferase CaiB-like acyl-CoA transferase